MSGAPSSASGVSRRSMLGAAALLPLAGPALAAAPTARAPLIDAHIHFFTNDFSHYPVDMRNAREPEDVMRARVLNAPVTPARMLPLWQEMGITGGIGVQYSGAYKTDNSYVLDTADAHPRQIHTEIILSSARPESVALLATLARTRHVSAIRLTGFVDADGDVPWLKSPTALELWSMAQDLGLPVGITYLVMTPRTAALETIRGLAERFPRCTVLLEHLGWTGGAGSADGLLPEHLALRDHPNIRFKWTTLNVDGLSGAGIDPAAFLRAAVDTFGADRLMWGSDYGNTTRPYAGIVADAHDATRLLTEAEAAAVLGGTARGLFRF